MTTITVDLNDSPRQIRAIAEMLMNYAGDNRQQELRYTPQEPLVTTAGWAQPTEVAGALTVQTDLEPEVLDAHGFPWDDRIHASSKARNADGTWRQRRNLDPAIRETVEEELKDKGFGKTVPVPVPAAPVPTPPAPVVETAVPTPPAPVAETAVPTPPAPSAPVAETFVPTITFPELMSRVTGAVSAGKLSMSEIPGILTSLGVNGGLPGLVATPEMIPLVATALGVANG